MQVKLEVQDCPPGLKPGLYNGVVLHLHASPEEGGLTLTIKLEEEVDV